MSISVILGICLAVFIFVICAEIIQRRRRMSEIKQQWGKEKFIGKQDSSLSLFDSLESYLKDSGSDPIDEQTWEDLNLEEVFRQFNRTYSSLGAEYLFSKINGIGIHDFKTSADLENFFSKHSGERFRILYIFDQLGKQSENGIRATLNSPPREAKWKKWCILYLAIHPFLSLLTIFISPMLAATLVLTGFAFNLVLSFLAKTRLNQKLDSLSYLVRMLTAARKISKIDSPLKEILVKEVKPFHRIQYLSIAFGKGDLSTDIGIIMEYLNTIFLLPFIAYYFLCAMIENHTDLLKKLHDHLSLLEASLALQDYKSTLPYYCYSVTNDKQEIQSEAIYHPLMTDMVANPVSFSQNIIMSGDNASGKSTYLRTVAVNAIISQLFGFAFAQSFSYQKGKVMTSMSVEDSLTNGESYFLAESHSIKKMVSAACDQKFTYLFIDELFKGTNTVDRLATGISLIEWLSAQKCRFMISTHDKEIIDYEGWSLEHLHFSSQYTEGRIRYDYQLKQGKAQTSNAINILETEAFPKEMISRAKELEIRFSQEK
ncbi:MutS-related protein [Streptococcus dentiloxodontae]